MKKHVYSMFVTMVLQVLALILYFCPMFQCSIVYVQTSSLGEMSYRGYEQTLSFTECFEGATWLLVIVLALHVLSVACVLLALKNRESGKRCRFVLPKISVFSTLTIWLILLIATLDTVSQYAQYGATGGLTFGGWVFILSMLATAVMLFCLSSQSRRLCAQRA